MPLYPEPDLEDENILLPDLQEEKNSKNGTSPTLGLSPDDFVILLTHTPDYAEDVPITNTDLVLAGHTHGGQVRENRGEDSNERGERY